MDLIKDTTYERKEKKQNQRQEGIEPTTHGSWGLCSAAVLVAVPVAAPVAVL